MREGGVEVASVSKLAPPLPAEEASSVLASLTGRSDYESYQVPRVNLLHLHRGSLPERASYNEAAQSPDALISGKCACDGAARSCSSRCTGICRVWPRARRPN
jgi:hypothetical protein